MALLAYARARAHDQIGVGGADVPDACGAAVASAGGNREPFASMLTRQLRGVLATVGHPRHYRRASVLSPQGQALKAVVLLDSGFVAEHHATSHGNEVIAALYGPGDLVGALTELDGVPSLVTARTLTAVTTTVIPGFAFRRLLRQHGELAATLARSVSQLLREAQQRHADAVTCKSVVVIGRRLLELGQRWGVPTDAGVELTIPLSQQELADWAGVSVEAATKALRVYREEGLVRTGRRRFALTEPARLERAVAALDTPAVRRTPRMR